MLKTGAQAFCAAQYRVKQLGQEEAVQVFKAAAAPCAVAVGTAVVHNKIVTRVQDLAPAVTGMLHRAAQNIRQLQKAVVVRAGLMQGMALEDQLLLLQLI